MFSGRMLGIIRYLEAQKTSSYKEVAQALVLKERNIRYDIDRINDILALSHLPVIQKESKGVLVFPDALDLSAFLQQSDFIYTQEERISILFLLLLIDNEKLKLGQMAEDFQVSRSTIKNDMSLLEAALEKDGVHVIYREHFILTGDKTRRVALLNREFRKQIHLLLPHRQTLTAAEEYSRNAILEAFDHAPLEQIFSIVNQFLEQLARTLTDNSYNWYLTNILIVLWFVIHEKEYPMEWNEVKPQDETPYLPLISKLEALISRPIDTKKRQVICRLLDYTHQQEVQNDELDIIFLENIVYDLLYKMSQKMGRDFADDPLLIEGLFTHIPPLIKRIQTGIQLHEDVVSLLSEENRYAIHMVEECTRDLPFLKNIQSEDEFTYLAILFLSSIKRRQSSAIRRTLLVCGYGYGTTTMLHEMLVSEYQLEVVETIPAYKLHSYENWAHIDLVLSTTPLNGLEIPKPYLPVHPILNAEDRSNIEKLGIARKKLSSSLEQIARQLDFLSAEDKTKVLAILRQSFGAPVHTADKQSHALKGLLPTSRIRIVDAPMHWIEAVTQSAEILEDEGCVTKNYKYSIIDIMNQMGFYSVTDDAFALLHGKSQTHVLESGLSLIVNRQPVTFGDKKIQIIFCLATTDTTSHIPAVTGLMRMVRCTDMIELVKHAQTPEEITAILKKCEEESLS